MINAVQLGGYLLKNSLYFYIALFTHPAIQIIQESDVLYVTSSIRDETYNNVWKTNFSVETLDQRINGIKNIFGEQPFIWWVDPSDTPTDLTKYLEQHKFTFVEQTTIMYHAQKELLPSCTGNIQVRRVSTAQELDDFCTVKGGTPEQIALNKQLFATCCEQQRYPIELFVAYHDHDPVCIAVTVQQDGIGSIHSFATKQEAQGKGYGTRMLNYALERLYSAGCSIVLLDSRAQAINFYEKNGFKATELIIKAYRSPLCA
ncbi:MAG: GNAT family N-acetyltransferase [Candidatus Babeliales bacterium]